uniref:Uncharacterized protein n=1 Tax=Avena sativa TaxID=4498 RepID=A0ACD5UWN5_AVESA
MLEIYEKLLKQVGNRARFLSGVLSGDINCINREKNELRQELMEKGFDPLPKEENAERPDADSSDYDYLTKMSVGSLDEEYLQHLLELKRRFEIKVGLLRKAAPQYLESEKEPALLGSTYRNAQSGRRAMLDLAAKDSQVSEASLRRKHKRTAAESLEASAMLTDDDDEEAPKLKDQSQEHIETECSQNQERTNQRKQRKKRRKESSAPKHCRRTLDFRGHDKSGDGFLVEEIKKIASGLDGIEISRCTNRDQSTHQLAKLNLRDASVSLCHEGLP